MDDDSICVENGISIHTPAKGVTLDHAKAALLLYDFNPHPREGGDPGLIIIRFFPSAFQSTPPRRG